MDGSLDALLGNAAGASGKGCGCKQSGGVKKYCKCFQQGRMCGDKCECFDSKNGGLEALKQLRRQQQEAEARRQPQEQAVQKADGRSRDDVEIMRIEIIASGRERINCGIAGCKGDTSST